MLFERRGEDRNTLYVDIKRGGAEAKQGTKPGNHSNCNTSAATGKRKRTASNVAAVERYMVDLVE